MTDKEKELYGTNASILDNTLTTTTYQIECDTPNGAMQCYHLFPGIDLAYTSFYASSCFKREKPLPHILEIAYCRAGRYECEYKHEYLTYLGEGDFAVTTMNPQSDLPAFPIGYYDGLAIIVDMEVTGTCFTNIVEDVAIDLSMLVTKFCSGHCCSVIKANPALAHVFNEICEARETNELGYLRLKVLEIFFLLSKLLPQDDIEMSAYYPGTQIKKIKALKAELVENLESKETLKSMADRYGMSLTMLKNCFKAVYGKPVYSFQREYKMQKATLLLTTTELSISEISGQLGYENPNKFSTAFHSIIGASPREYRMKNK
ncbi:MAG: AraC family transcriptional regulator [Lachnospiraceae bacterium]|nr:AraC family transcriptional regulator [Lachnospiraceae bacterium]